MLVLKCKPETYLQPVLTSPTRLIVALYPVELLHHQTLAGSLDALFEQVLYLIQLVGIPVFCKSELSFCFYKCRPQQISTCAERLGNQCLYSFLALCSTKYLKEPEIGYRTYLSIQEEQVKRKDAHSHSDIFRFHIFSLSRHELLERKNLFLVNIPRHRFAIQHEAFHVRLHPGRKLCQHVRILSGQVFRVPRKYVGNALLRFAGCRLVLLVGL